MPLVSVAIPVRDEGRRTSETIVAIASSRRARAELEFVVVDDGSTDGGAEHLDRVVRSIDRARLVLVRSEQRLGVPRARNLAAAKASGDVLFMTDAHVRFSAGWDEHVLEHLRPDRVLAATVTDGGGFSATGCVLSIPFMGTYWNHRSPGPLEPVQVAACPATVMGRETFDRLGGYDQGMLMYGAAEPEFSVRAWLSGAQIVALPQVKVEHQFKPPQHREDFLDEMRPFMVHNAVRFAILYLDDLLVLQTVRQHSERFGEQARQGLQLLVDSDVYVRRDCLRKMLVHDFAWYVERFGVKDQAGREVDLGRLGSAWLGSAVRAV
jgi:glycosyltransferase involved in cell wall biosynthesis